jgi:hypothetical protein
MTTSFTKLPILSKITDTVLKKVYATTDDDWFPHLELSIFSLVLDDFSEDPEIVALIRHFGCESRLSVFRFPANSCYSWHRDSTRKCSINMLLQGFDSMCVFGDFAIKNKFTNIERLTHEHNAYYAMDVSKWHTVYNFDDTRYVLSIGVPNNTYEDVIRYFDK